MAYLGTSADIPFGSFGVLSDLAPTDLPVNCLIDANNIDLLPGVVQKAPGGRRLNSVALPSGVVSLFDWHPNENTQKTMAACENGAIYFDTGPGDMNGNVPIATGLTNLTPNCQFVSGGQEIGGRAKKLFFFSFGENQIKVLNNAETAFSDIALPAADWTSGDYPKVGVIHRNSLWVFSKQLSYGSDSGNHENFQSNFLVSPVFPGEGGDIRGAYVFKGKLFCFKDGGFVYILNDEDVDTTNWYWQKIGGNFGLAAPNAVTEVLDDMIAGNTTGTATSYAATNALGDVESADIFRAASAENYLRETTSTVGIPFQHMIYYAAKKLLFMTYRSAYYTYNNMLFCIDFSRSGAPPRVLPQIKGKPQCLALRKDINEVERPIYGDKDGYVILMDSENRLEGGAAYEGSFQTVHMDMSHLDPKLAGVNKKWDWLKVKYKPQGDWNLSCDYFVDGKYIDTIYFPMIQYQDPQLDELLLGTGRLGQSNIETFKRPLTSMGKTISFRFYNSGSNQNFSVAGIVVGFRPTGEQAQRT